MSTVTTTQESEFDDTPALRSTVYALTGGSFLLALGVASLVWVVGALRFAGDLLAATGLTQVVGIVAMTVLSLLLFAYGWALVARGLTEIIARGVAAGMAR